MKLSNIKRFNFLRRTKCQQCLDHSTYVTRWRVTCDFCDLHTRLAWIELEEVYGIDAEAECEYCSHDLPVHFTLEELE